MRFDTFAAWLTVAFIVAILAAAYRRAMPEIKRRWEAEKERQARKLAKAREELETIGRSLAAAVAEEEAQRAQFRETIARVNRSALSERLRTQPAVCGAEHSAAHCQRAAGHEGLHGGQQRWQRAHDVGGAACLSGWTHPAASTP